MGEAETIAKGLTKAQRMMLERLPGKFGRGRGMAGKVLTEKGLAEPCRRYAFQHVLTPLGLEVRRHLLEGADNAEG